MKKFAVNYNKLEKNLEDKPKVFKLSEVKDRLKKVAFDVVKFQDSDGLDGLWQVSQTDDGEYIVALYEDAPLTVEASAPTPWQAIPGDGCVHVFYNSDPVTKISLASVGVPEDEAEELASTLPESLASNKKLVRSMLDELTDEVKAELFESYPELQD